MHPSPLDPDSVILIAYTAAYHHYHILSHAISNIFYCATCNLIFFSGGLNNEINYRNKFLCVFLNGKLDITYVAMKYDATRFCSSSKNPYSNLTVSFLKNRPSLEQRQYKNDSGKLKDFCHALCR